MAEPIRYEKDAEGIVMLTMDLEGPVNKMSQEFIASLVRAIDRLEKEQGEIKGAILTSAKEVFLAGADLTELVKLQPESSEQFFQAMEQTKGMLRRLEKIKRPIVAAINGAALGGGLELSHACHHRILLNSPKIKVGQPEVKLGLLPGAGGCVRLTWLLGAEMALPVLLEGKEYRPEEAQMLGLVDELASSPEEMITKAKDWIRANPDPKQPWDRSDYKVPGGRLPSPNVAQVLNMASVMVFKRTKGAVPAVEEILKVVAQALTVDFDAALRVESRHFITLATGPVAKNMVSTFFFQMREINAGASRPKNVPKNTIAKLGVLGAGMMGRGIAVVSALSGIEVVLKDVSADAAKKSLDLIEKSLEGNPKKDAILSHIRATGNTADLFGCDLIIEAVFEKVDLKASVTKEAEPNLKADGFFASNTSTLPITMLSEASQHPEKFIGIHFFSPVEKMPLVEIIVGKKTSDETLAKAFDYVLQIRKTPIVVNDSRGFFTSRVIGTYLEEAVRLLVEGVHPARIERVARGAGFPVGPLALWDEVSQRLGLEVAKTNAALDATGGKTAVARGSAVMQVAERLVTEFNRGGKAYGGGVYDYPAGAPKRIWPKIIELYYKPDYKISDEDIQGRLKYRQSVETIRCMEEGVLRSARDANIGSIFGIGFPPTTGGVIQAVNAMGTKNFLQLMEDYTTRFGPGFTPPALLKQMAKSGARFE